MRMLPILLLVCGLIRVDAKAPHIIFIMADDVGYECFGCYGSRQYKTPHIDRMAAQGLRFSHCYSQPLCTPSRVKVMTGLSNVRNYAAFSVLRNDQKTFGHFLKESGYTTVIAGKWQLLGAAHYAERFRGKGSLPQKMGFDRHCLWQVDQLGGRYWNPLLTMDGAPEQFGRDDYGPDLASEYLMEFMEKNSGGERPMFIYYPMILVHNPFDPTPDSASRKGKDKQKNFEDMVSYMDSIIGRMVKKTEELGIAENTLILFTGDNGTNKAIRSRLGGRVIQGGKGKMDDSGTRVPLVAYWPGTIEGGQVTDRLVDFSDFLPTFQELAGGPELDGLDGVSFAPEFRGEKGGGREWMYCFYHPRPEWGEAVRFVRDQEWKLYGDGRFYHVANDVAERNPLGPEGGDAVARAKLRKAMRSMPAVGQSLLKFE